MRTVAILLIGLSMSAATGQESFVGKTADAWLQQLKSTDPVQRRGAAYALGKMSKSAAATLPELKAALGREADAKARDALVFALGEVCRLSDSARADRDLEPLLLKALKDDSAAVRRSAAFALGCLGTQSNAARAALDAALDDAQPMVKQNAAWALGHFGPAALPSLQKALRDADSLVKRDAASALMLLTNAEDIRRVLKELHPLCRDSNSEVRRAALNLLVRIVDPSDKEVIPSLAAALNDRDLENRRNAALALTNIGGADAAVALDVLLGAARDSDVELRRQAVIGISNIGPAAAKAVPDLMRIFTSDPDVEVRRNAAITLGYLRRAAEPAVPLLVQKVRDKSGDQPTRVKCAESLSYIGAVPAAVQAVPLLLQVIEDARDDIEVRERAIWSLRVHGGELRKMTGPLETFTKVVREPVSEANKMLRYDCAYMLGVVWQSQAPDAALDVLSAFLADPTIKLYEGTVIGVEGTFSETKGGTGTTKVRTKGDAREMAAVALKAIGETRYAARADIMKQLRALAADPKTYPPLREKAAAMVKSAS